MEVKHPLHEAILAHKKDVVQFLLDNGVSPNLLDENGNTPMYIAMMHKYYDVMETLFNHKADCSILKSVSQRTNQIL